MVVNSALGAEVEACKYIWRIMREFVKNNRNAFCVDSENMVEMFEEVRAGLSDNRKGFDDVKELSINYPKVNLYYVNRRWPGIVKLIH